MGSPNVALYSWLPQIIDAISKLYGVLSIAKYSRTRIIFVERQAYVSISTHMCMKNEFTKHFCQKFMLSFYCQNFFHWICQTFCCQIFLLYDKSCSHTSASYIIDIETAVVLKHLSAKCYLVVLAAMKISQQNH